MSAAAQTSPVIKILVVGDAGVGKTSLIQRYVNDEFLPERQPTVGVDFFVKEISLESGRSGSSSIKNVRVQLWDIAGQDRAKKVNRVYFKGALGAIIVYDISRPQTFDSATKWKQELDANITPNGHALPSLLLGNKVDLEVAKVDVSYVDSFVQKHGFIAWSDVSAKDMSNVDMEVPIACLVSRILCDEELFETGVRQSATVLSKRKKELATSPGLHLGSRGLRMAADVSGKNSTESNSCCG